MWNFLKGILLVKATGTARPVRIVLVFIFMGSVIAGVIYAFLVFQAVQQRNPGYDVRHHSNH